MLILQKMVVTFGGGRFAAQLSHNEDNCNSENLEPGHLFVVTVCDRGMVTFLVTPGPKLGSGRDNIPIICLEALG